jgi:3'-5' exoribonuclease
MQFSPFVSELIPREDVEGAFLVKYLNIQTDKKGKPYLNLVLMDKTGEVEGRIWDDAAQIFDQIQAKDIVRVAGKVNLFQGKKQLVLAAIQKATPGSYSDERFIPTTVYDVDRMHADLMEIIGRMQDPFSRELAQSIFNSPELKPLILRAPAAKTMHHAYAGGLLEHVLSICRIMEFLGNHYQNYYGKALRKDLLILGGLFHDIGKIEELSWERGTEYTDSGKLIGHLIQGCELVDRHIAKIPGFPEDFRLEVKHQILAHHGHLEFGSPKLPATVEAMLVHAIDDLDSKVNSIFGIIEKDQTPGNWTAFQRNYERIFRKPTIAPKIQGQSPGIA